MEFNGFKPAMLVFLKQLIRHNNRPWFLENKSRYERDVLAPSLRFIRGFRAELTKISPFFVAEDKRVGGSLMRVYRDMRFSKNKTPYKTNVGIQFRHEMGKDVHAPGFYVHIEPGASFLGVGVWHPDSSTLRAIRQAIDDEPGRWKRAKNAKRFVDAFELAGESLKTAPRDFQRDHPLINDLKRKDFIGVRPLTDDLVLDDHFLEHVAQSFRAGRPFMRFLCSAIGIPF